MSLFSASITLRARKRCNCVVIFLLLALHRSGRPLPSLGREQRARVSPWGDPMSPRMRLVLVAAVLVALAGAGVAAYMIWFRVRLPQPGSPEYDHYLDTFYVGTAMVDSDRKEVALARLDKAIELVPHEPAAWANRGLVYLRDNDKASAARDLKRAAQLAPDSTEIEALLGHLARAQGDFTAAAKHFRKVVEKNPRDLESIYTLAEIVSQEGKADSEVEYQKLMERILEVQPNNLHVLVKRASAAFQNKDRKAFDDALQR